MDHAPMLFDLPPSLPPEWRRALGKPQALEIIAQALLVRKASRALRGDGMTAGPSVLIDSIPAFSALPVDHCDRRVFQKLAGLIEDEGLRALRGAVVEGVTVPTEARVIEAAMRRKRTFAKALRAAAAAVESFQADE